MRLPLRKIVHLASRAIVLSKHGYDAAERQELLADVLDIAVVIAPEGELPHAVLGFVLQVVRQIPGGLDAEARATLVSNALDLVQGLVPDDIEIPLKAA